MDSPSSSINCNMNFVSGQYHKMVKDLRAVGRIWLCVFSIKNALTLLPAGGVLYSNDGGECGCGNAECGCENDMKEETE